MIAGAPSVVPAGGFTYNRDGENLHAFDRDSLITALTNYRIANSLDIGRPDIDVDEEMSGRSPTYITPFSTGEIAKGKAEAKKKTFLDQVKDWLANRYALRDRNAIKYVTRVEANRRANICARCPQNREWRNSCTACVANVERNVVMLSKNIKTQQHGVLGGCALFGHENRVAVVLDKKNLAHANRPEYKGKAPKACWLRT